MLSLWRFFSIYTAPNWCFLSQAPNAILLRMKGKSFSLLCLPHWVRVMSGWLATKQGALRRACSSHCSEKVRPRGCSTEVVSNTMKDKKGLPKPVNLNSAIKNPWRRKISSCLIFALHYILYTPFPSVSFVLSSLCLLLSEMTHSHILTIRCNLDTGPCEHKAWVLLTTVPWCAQDRNACTSGNASVPRELRV